LQKGTHTYIEDKRNENIKIYINGKYYNRKDACISVFDSGFLLGDGVWEGVRLLNGNLVFIDQHMQRLYDGAKELSINIDIKPAGIIKIINKLLELNQMFTGVHIRIIISRGLKKTPYQHPNVNIGGCSIVIIPEYKEADPLVNKNGIKLVTVNTIRGTQNSQDPRLNTLSKLNCIIACIEANKKGADEGIMLDINGNISTCNSTNFFMVKNQEIWTSTGDFCLPGITRQTVIDLCLDNKINILEKDFVIDDIYKADEIFVTGTFAGIIPAVEVDGREISDGIRGQITYKIQNLYQNKLNQLYLK